MPRSENRKDRPPLPRSSNSPITPFFYSTTPFGSQVEFGAMWTRVSLSWNLTIYSTMSTPKGCHFNTTQHAADTTQTHLPAARPELFSYYTRKFSEGAQGVVEICFYRCTVQLCMMCWVGDARCHRLGFGFMCLTVSVSWHVKGVTVKTGVGCGSGGVERQQDWHQCVAEVHRRQRRTPSHPTCSCEKRETVVGPPHS